MLPVSLLIALMILTWAAAAVATFTEEDNSSGGADGTEPGDQDYHDAA